MVEFGEDLSITYVMGGLARQFEQPDAQIVPWLDAAEKSRMPVDPRLWAEAPLPIPTGSRQMATNNTDNEKRRIPRSCSPDPVSPQRPDGCFIGSHPRTS